MCKTVRRGGFWAAMAWMAIIGFGCADGTGGAGISLEEVFSSREATIEATVDGTMIRLTDVWFSSGKANLGAGSTTA